MFARIFAFRSTQAAAGSLLLDGLATAPVAAYSLRKLRTAYAGSPIRVIRASDSIQQDIGFSGNDLDTSALTTFGSGTNVDIINWYDQSANSDGGSPAGSTRMLTGASGKRFRIVTAGVLQTANGKPAGLTSANNQGYSSPTFTGYTGSTLAGAAVCAPGTQNLARAGIAFVKDNSTDFGAATRGSVCNRSGTTAELYTLRNFANPSGTIAITNGVVYSIFSRFTGSVSTIARAGANNSGASTGAFDVNQVYWAMEDDTGGQAGPGGIYQEAIAWMADPGATEMAAVNADQIAYWGCS